METLEEEYDESPTPTETRNHSNPFNFAEPFSLSTGPSSSITPVNPITNGLISQDADLTMSDDPTLSWLNMDLDSLLAQSLPPLDMSLYQSMGDLAPIPSDTVPYGADSSAYAFPVPDISPHGSTLTAHTPHALQNIASSVSYTPVTPQVQSILRDFCEFISIRNFAWFILTDPLDDRFLGPAWAVTYPPGTREVMLGRHKHVAKSHLLNQRCKEAAAAICTYILYFRSGGFAHQSDIKVLKQWHHIRAPIQGVIGSDEVTPYLELNVDAEAIAHEATVMARCPKECVLSPTRETS